MKQANGSWWQANTQIRATESRSAVGPEVRDLSANWTDSSRGEPDSADGLLAGRFLSAGWKPTRRVSQG